MMFETKKRGDETIVVFTNKASDKLQSSVFKAHGTHLPNDWIFDKYQSILGTMIDYDINSIDKAEDKRAEIVDSLVDIYNSDLTAWLNQSIYNIEYLDNALSEFEVKDGVGLLQQAQYMAIDEIYSEVVGLLES